MKLNPDCVRDILMAVEEVTAPYVVFEYNKKGPIPSKLEKHEHDEIVYHINQCQMAGLITSIRFFDGGDLILIGDLTPAGHEFLANTRKEQIWNKTKDVAAKVGSTSLGTIMQIATSIVTELVKNHFGIT